MSVEMINCALPPLLNNLSNPLEYNSRPSLEKYAETLLYTLASDKTGS